MVVVEVDAAGWEVLSRSACLELLDTVRVGRIGVSIDALPVVVPVRFSLGEGEVVVDLFGNERLSTALVGAIVAFEAGRLELWSGGAWTVLVQGVSRLYANTASGSGGPRTLRGRALAPNCGPLAGISTELVSGRRHR